jgi:hypothetical protein
LPCLQVVPNTWESQIIVPYVFLTYNGTTYIYYNGYDGSRWQVGLAQFGGSLIPNFNVNLETVVIIIVTSILAISLIVVVLNILKKNKRK